MSVSLNIPDAEELADFLRFLSEWLTGDPRQLGDSLARLMGGHPYGVETLQHDLSRFRSLLGDDDRDRDFSALSQVWAGAATMKARAWPRDL